MTTKEKSQAELEIEALADVFNIATSGFEEFYKKTKGSASGDSSKAASSGNSSKAASSGDYSTAASSGNSSKAASSGNSSKAASSGDYSTAASSGDYSTAASSGNSSKAASSGNSSTAASSGNFSKAASSGDYSTAASSGNSSKAASSGDYSKAASSGDYSTAASSGDYSTAASSGNFSTAASSGNSSACTAVGYRAAVKGDKGNLIMASEYIIKDGKCIPVGGKADIVDGKILKADCWYIVENGKWVQVDFTDGIFSRVISNRKGVKKVKTDNGQILFVVSDDKGNSAHGETIAKAQEDLVYKVVAKFDGKIPKSATGKEWVGIYRAVTGACAAGVKMFVEEIGKSLDDVYTSEQILTLVQGKFGSEQFAKVVRGENV
jgi:hypothetical protein